MNAPKYELLTGSPPDKRRKVAMAEAKTLRYRFVFPLQWTATTLGTNFWRQRPFRISQTKQTKQHEITTHELSIFLPISVSVFGGGRERVLPASASGVQRQGHC